MIGPIIDSMERGLVPDVLIRAGIRKLCSDRLKSLKQRSLELRQNYTNAYIELLRSSPIAVHTEDANRQHYEVPSEFFALCLGKNRKYSSAYWPEGCESLDEAEDAALEITMARAGIVDGMRILELGCGWGSLTLAMAKRFPNSSIVALSNSSSQREYIESQAALRGLKNITVLTRNIEQSESLDAELGLFDRVVSVEMFEHLRNYEKLFERVSCWMKDDAKMFVHIFTHHTYPYLFEVEGEDNWLGKYFFTGGQMPSHELLAHFQKNLVLETQWAWDGTHYGRTSEAWLKNLDDNRASVLAIFKRVYGESDAARWVERWRIFFLSCAELFAYDKGSEWGVSHYLFTKRTGQH
jgi:cyclopropane-fatty-acyl-phospholipid synthase